MNNLTKACKALSLALTYAEDGAVVSAIECGTEAMSLLFAERDRRLKIGLILRTQVPALADTPPNNKIVTGPGTFRARRQHTAATRDKMAAAAKRRKRT